MIFLLCNLFQSDNLQTAPLLLRTTLFFGLNILNLIGVYCVLKFINLICYFLLVSRSPILNANKESCVSFSSKLIWLRVALVTIDWGDFSGLCPSVGHLGHAHFIASEFPFNNAIFKKKIIFAWCWNNAINEEFVLQVFPRRRSHTHLVVIIHLYELKIIPKENNATFAFGAQVIFDPLIALIVWMSSQLSTS